ncbi:Flp family type IVb pilin [Profundibacter sp.]
MTDMIKNFAADESGAVTVDWVVLTAAIVGLGLAVMTVISDGTSNLTNKIKTKMTSQTISTTF